MQKLHIESLPIGLMCQELQQKSQLNYVSGPTLDLTPAEVILCMSTGPLCDAVICFAAYSRRLSSNDHESHQSVSAFDHNSPWAIVMPRYRRVSEMWRRCCNPGQCLPVCPGSATRMMKLLTGKDCWVIHKGSRYGRRTHELKRSGQELSSNPQLRAVSTLSVSAKSQAQAI